MLLCCLTSLVKWLELSKWPLFPLNILSGKSLCFRTAVFKNLSWSTKISSVKFRVFFLGFSKTVKSNCSSFIYWSAIKLIFIENIQTYWRIDLLFINNYRRVTKRRCSSKTKNSMKIPTAAKKNTFFSRALPGGCFLSKKNLSLTLFLTYAFQRTYELWFICYLLLFCFAFS